MSNRRWGTIVFWLWLVIVLLGNLYGATCGSTCPSAHTIRQLSPRWLAKPLATAGPLPLWLLLVAYHLFHNRNRRWSDVIVSVQRAVAPLLAPTLFAYLSYVMTLRYLHYVVDYDPSGHIAIVGAQIVPLAVCLDVKCSGPHAAPSMTVPTVVVGAIVVILVAVWSWFSFITAGFFHTFADLVPSIAFVLWCLFDTYTAVFQQQQARAEALRVRATMAVVMWAVSVVLFAILVDVLTVPPPIITSVLYDGILFVFGFYLVRTNDRT